MPHRIAKDFNFCFGHRVWTQVLNADYANDLKCACRHLHGHEAKVTVHLSADKLTDSMVTDFRHLEWLKRFLDSHIDHKFVIDRNDPLFARLTEGSPVESAVEMPANNVVGYHFGAALSALDEEYYGSFLVVDFVPTSENFSRWLFDIVSQKMAPLGVKVDAIEWWESSKSRAVFSVDGGLL